MVIDLFNFKGLISVFLKIERSDISRKKKRQNKQTNIEKWYDTPKSFINCFWKQTSDTEMVLIKEKEKRLQ